jgi:hypothetical protein
MRSSTTPRRATSDVDAPLGIGREEVEPVLVLAPVLRSLEQAVEAGRCER